MTLTTAVKDEIVRVSLVRSEEMTAELAGVLRYGGALNVVAGNIVIEAEVDNAPAAKRMMEFVKTLYNYEADMQVIGAGSARKKARYVVRWPRGGAEISRRTGLIDRTGRPVMGLPRTIIGGSQDVCVAAWRGAFLARGALTEPGRSFALEVTAPSNESALALVGAARRIGITAKTKETRGSHRVIVRDGESISKLLELIGAHKTRVEWEERRARREVRTSANRLANFDDANLRRSARAAIAAAARVERALSLLGDDVPEHLAQAGRLRAQHRQASLEELGQLADPPMTKDAVAGRIRRLLSMADKRAEDLGLPDTHAAVTDELFTDVE